jgi:phosphopantetheinyl transferase (holo-ACP synthase)
MDDIEVRRLTTGKPELHLYGEALAVATQMRATHFHVSLTHDQLISSAIVILEA